MVINTLAIEIPEITMLIVNHLDPRDVHNLIQTSSIFNEMLKIPDNFVDECFNLIDKIEKSYSASPSENYWGARGAVVLRSTSLYQYIKLHLNPPKNILPVLFNSTYCLSSMRQRHIENNQLVEETNSCNQQQDYESLLSGEILANEIYRDQEKMDAFRLFRKDFV